MTKILKLKKAKNKSAFAGDFKHDLLLIDLEMTGLDVNKHEIIQIAGVLLDRKSLKEKACFNTFVAPVRWHNRDKESMRVNGIKAEWVKNAPTLGQVLKVFNRKFNPKRVILCNYGGPLDMDFLRKAYAEHRIKWQFDYHFLNLWAYFFVVLASRKQLTNHKKFTGFSLENLVKKYQVKTLGARHDALTDCRIEAEVFRQMVISK